MRTRYQYHLYGLNGEFMGLTTRKCESASHKAKLPELYYFHRYEYDPNDPDWTRASTHNLTCTDHYKKGIEP